MIQARDDGSLNQAGRVEMIRAPFHVFFESEPGGLAGEVDMRYKRTRRIKVDPEVEQLGGLELPVISLLTVRTVGDAGWLG